MLTGKQLEAYLAHVVLGRKLPQRERIGPRTGPPRKGRHAMKDTRTGSGRWPAAGVALKGDPKPRMREWMVVCR